MKGAYWTDLKEKLQVNMIWLKEQIECVGNGKESNVLTDHPVKIQYLKIMASTDACKVKELEMGFLETRVRSLCHPLILDVTRWV